MLPILFIAYSFCLLLYGTYFLQNGRNLLLTFVDFIETHCNQTGEESMIRTVFVLVAICFLACLSTCKKEENSKGMPQTDNQSSEQKKEPMKNTISIAEIPVTDLTRAIKFYETILGVTIEKMSMEGTEMGVLPANESSVNVVLVKGEGYTPTKNGVVLYLDAGNDLMPALEKVEKNGGKILLPKTQISPEMGYYALFLDSEGNRLGFHSKK